MGNGNRKTGNSGFWLLASFPRPRGGEAGSQKPGARMGNANRRTGNSGFWLLASSPATVVDLIQQGRYSVLLV